MDEFKEELRHIINFYNIDTQCGIPDFILSEYIIRDLTNLRITKEHLELYNKGK